MKRKRRRINERIEQVLRGVELGLPLARACAAAGLPRSTFYMRLEQSKRLQRRLREAEARLIELAASNVFTAVAQGDLKASLWVLERREPEYAPHSVVKQRLREEQEKPLDIEPEFVVYDGGETA